MSFHRPNRLRIRGALCCAGVLLIFALGMAAASPLRQAAAVNLPAPMLAAQADEGPVPDDEPAVEDDDGGGDGAGDDSEAAPEPAVAPATTAAPRPATTPAASTATAAATPSIGKSLGDGTFLAPHTTSNGVKVFRLTMTAVNWEVSASKVFEAYTFNGIVPGPVLRINEGDRVRFIVKNDLPISTGVHWHGMILPNQQDGIPGLTQKSIDPGETYTYEWTAVAAGTHWYHSHSSGSDIGRGLYGALEVIPKEGEFKADRDYRLIVGDTNLGFVLNGKSYPYTAPLAARVGERVRIRLIGAGDLSHPFHLHGMTFAVVAQDGIPIEHPQTMDTLLVSAGQTFDLIAKPTVAGRWLTHCHIFSHSHMADTDPTHAMNTMNAPVTGVAAGMMGLTTTLDVSPASGSLPEPAPASPAAADSVDGAASPTAAPAPASQPAVALSGVATSRGSANGVAVIGGALLVALTGLYIARQRHAKES